MAPRVLGRTGREALGQVDSEPQGWELCWWDPRYLSTPLCQLQLQIPPLYLQEFVGPSYSYGLGPFLPTSECSHPN